MGVTLYLLKTAYSNGNYRYYHLLSGVDMPLHNQNYIHNFFEKNDGIEFVSFASSELNEERKKRIRFYWVFQECIGKGSGRSVFIRLLKLIRYVTITIQKLFRIDRLNKLPNNFVIASGSNWFSVTDDLVQYIIEKEQWVYDTFRYGVCVDEMFVQTIVRNSFFENRLYANKFDDESSGTGNMRLIDWERGGPYIWKSMDCQELISSPCLFARKFDIEIDSKIIEMVKETVCSGQN